MAQTTTTQIAPAVSEYYDRVLLRRALPFLTHDKFGQRRPIPKGSGKLIKFRKYSSLSPATTALTEGVTPDSVQLSKSDITATASQYGNVVTLSDVVQLINVEGVLVEASKLLGENAGESLDEIYRGVLVAGTNVQYANGATPQRSEVNTIIATDDIEKVIRLLNNNIGKLFTSIIKAGTGQGTLPIRPAFWAICHPDVAYDLDKMTGWIPAEKYASVSPLHENEIGAYKNVRFIMSTKGKIWAGAGATGGSSVKETGSNADVYATLVFAQDAYGISDIRGEAMHTYIEKPGTVADPLHQRTTVGWKAFTVAKILNDAWMCRIESAASA